MGITHIMNKSSLATLVVIMDILICISFLASLYILESFENIENHEIGKSILKVEDFSV